MAAGTGPAGLRLRRSVLFTPGTRGDRIEKALSSGTADVVVADLEDAVAPEEKEEARQGVRAALDSAPQDADGSGPERCVRINTWGGPWAARDLEAVMPARPDVIVLPKAERRAHLVVLDATLSHLEQVHGITRGSTRVMPIIETARGVLEAPALAAAPRVVALAFGAEDLAADAGLRRTRAAHEVFYARSRVALAAAASRVDAIDQVFVDLDDVDGIGEEARFARTLGYRGKMVLHPKQVAPVHTAFTPSDEEVIAARRLVEAVRDAEVGTGGVLRFEGRMIDVPLIQQARRVLAEAAAAGKDIGSE